MKKVVKANLYFLIILLLETFGSNVLRALSNIFKITDIRIQLFLSHFLVFIIPAIIYILISKKSAKEILKLNKINFVDILLLIVLSFACQPIVTFCSLISQLFFNNNIGEVVTSIIDTPYIVFLLLFAVMPAITEEITMRGIVLSGYEEKNVYISSIVIGLFFGMMHLDGQQFLYAAVLGFILALVVRITNSIYASMIMHFFINGTQVTLQKLVYKLPASNAAIEEAANISFMDMPTITKVFSICFYGILAVGFSIAVFFIIKKLIDLNVRRGTITKEEMKFSLRNRDNKIIDREKDRIINIPFILSVAVYFIVMIFLI